MKIALSNFYRLRLVPGNPVCLSLLLASNIFLSGNKSLPSTALLTMVVKAPPLSKTPPPLSQGLDDRPPSLSEGLDPTLWRDPHKVVDLPLNTTTNFLERSFNFFFKSFPNFPSVAIGRSPVNFKLSTIVATENVKILSIPERQRRIRNWKIIF